MSKTGNSGKAIKGFLDGVMGEVRKTAWPGRQELVESTTVVIVSLFLLALFVGVCDKVVATLLRLIIPSA